jgi:gamma-glutamyltranspeptidase/glutathione hydrolase
MPIARFFALLLCLALPAQAQAPSRDAPEPAVEMAAAPRGPVRAEDLMVVAAHPAAAEAGLEILRRGGSAVDAAVAVQMVLTLVEPQSSGIGGGAFLVHFDADDRLITTYDGRETAPAAAGPDLFLDQAGAPLPWAEAVSTGRAVGVPGVLAMLEKAHRDHGRLPWATLFETAIRLSREGFPVTPRLNGLLDRSGADAFSQAARDYFFDTQGRPRPVGYRLRNPVLAETFERIAREGADGFYLGPIATDIVTAVRTAPRMPGEMTLRDLADYVARRRPPVCADYKRRTICGMGPPSSGGIAVAQTLAFLHGWSLDAPLSPQGLHLIAEAEKLAFADRDRYVADPDKTRVPAGLLDPDYLDARGDLLSLERTIRRAEPGTPPGLDGGAPGQGSGADRPGTSQISIVDGDGNAVSMTTSIESAFGARLMVRGFLLNNQLTDFSFEARDAQGRPVANRVEGGKRPRSTMAPTLVFAENGTLRMVLGSPGGSRIPLYVVKAIVGVLDWGLDAQAAADLANFGSRNGPFEIEEGFADLAAIQALRDRGHEIVTPEMTSGLNIIVRQADGTLEGGSDRRREGVALGE